MGFIIRHGKKKKVKFFKGVRVKNTLKVIIENFNGFLGLSVPWKLLKYKNIEELLTSAFYLYGRNMT